MIYIVSDLHGCYDLYIKLIEQIDLQEEDTLFILGDLVDRGDKPMEILLDIAERDNVVALCGNHDYEARFFLEKYTLGEMYSTLFVEAFNLWIKDGGNTTFEGFINLSVDKQQKVLKVLKSQAVFKELEVNHQKFLMAHTVPEKERFEDFDSCVIHDFIMGEPDYELVYDDNLVIITGHTPTSFIDESFTGRFWKQNNHIAIDCGAVFYGVLGCLCLDTLEEIYVR